MTKTAALYAFWSSFGLEAYEENSVPTGSNAPAYPYITYQAATGKFGSQLALSGSVWDRDKDGYSAEVGNNRIAEKIAQKFANENVLIPCDGGNVWIQDGELAAQNLSDPGDDQIHRKLINIIVSFNTTF